MHQCADPELQVIFIFPAYFSVSSNCNARVTFVIKVISKKGEI